MEKCLFPPAPGVKQKDNLEPSTFPIQKGSLSRLRQKWESSDYHRNESYPGGSRCKLFQLKESNLLEPEGEALSTLDPPEAPSLPCCKKEEVLCGEPEDGVPEDQNDKLKDCGQPEVLKEDSLTGRRRIERFSIALDELRSIFESPKSSINSAGPVEYVQKEVEIGRSLCSPTFRSLPGSHADDFMRDSDLKSEEVPLDKMSPKSGQSPSMEAPKSPVPLSWSP